MSLSRKKYSTSNHGKQSSVTTLPPMVNSFKTTSNNDKETVSTRALNVNKMCFKCQGFKHVASDCPNQKIISLVEEVKEEPIIEEVEDELEIFNEDEPKEVIVDH